MLGAARALFGKRPGIACILGTGANSCLYDGEKIVMNTPRWDISWAIRVVGQ